MTGVDPVSEDVTKACNPQDGQPMELRFLVTIQLKN